MIIAKDHLINLFLDMEEQKAVGEQDQWELVWTELKIMKTFNGDVYLMYLTLSRRESLADDSGGGQKCLHYIFLPYPSHFKSD